MYAKSILITQDKRLESYIRQLLRRLKMDIETAYPLLSDLDSIRYDLMKNRITVNIRGEFAQFIKENGFPVVTIIDYIIDLGLSEKEDPDQRKLLRTFLLAFTLLANAKGFENAKANIVFVIPKRLRTIMSNFVENPSFLLDEVRTKDERINVIIDTFAAKKEKVKDYFRLSYIFRPDDGRYLEEMEKLEETLKGFAETTAEAVESEKSKSAVSTPMIKDDLEPARVLCRASSEKIIMDGELVPTTEEQRRKYIEKNIHLEGAITQKTITAVKDRILTTFSSMAKINPFKKDEKVFIIVPDSSIIDGSFAGVMGTFLSSAFPEYTGISLNMGKENCEKAKNSQGYVAIKDYIIKNL
jgi:hypothetical protein